MGTLAEFQNSALAASANTWKVLLDPLDGGQLGTADAKTIVVKASNLVYVSGPPDTEDETWWTSPQEDAEIAQLLEQRLSQGAGDGGGADGGGAGQAGPGGLSGGAEPRSGARDASEFKVRGCGQDALATDRCKFPRPSLSLPPSLSLFTLSDQYSLCVGGRRGAGTLAAEGGFQWPFRHPDALARGCQSLGC